MEFSCCSTVDAALGRASGVVPGDSLVGSPAAVSTARAPNKQGRLMDGAPVDRWIRIASNPTAPLAERKQRDPHACPGDAALVRSVTLWTRWDRNRAFRSPWRTRVTHRSTEHRGAKWTTTQSLFIVWCGILIFLQKIALSLVYILMIIIYFLKKCWIWTLFHNLDIYRYLDQ